MIRGGRGKTLTRGGKAYIATCILRYRVELDSIRPGIPQLPSNRGPSVAYPLSAAKGYTYSRQEVLIDVFRVGRVEIPRVVPQRVDMGHEVQVTRHVRQGDRAVRGRRKGEEAEATPQLVSWLRPVARGQRRRDTEDAVVRHVWVRAERVVGGEGVDEERRLREGECNGRIVGCVTEVQRDESSDLQE